MGGGALVLLLALGAAYLMLFWTVSSRFPTVALFMVFALAPFQNDVSGLGWLHFSLSEVHLLLACPLLIFRGWRGQLDWMGAPLWGGLFVFFALTVPHWRDSSMVSLVQMGLYWIAAVAAFLLLPRVARDWQVCWYGLVGVGFFLAVMAVLTRSSYFLGLNKNGVGASLSCALIVCVECWSNGARKGRWKWVPVMLVLCLGLVLVLSRGAWLAAIVGVGYLLAWRGQYRRLAQLGALVLPVALLAWSLLPQESRQYASSFDSSRYSIRARELNTEWVMEQWRGSPWLGVGVGLRKEYDATNAFWLTLAEVGPLGVAAFLTAHGAVLWGIWRRREGLKNSMGPVPSAHALAGALVLAKFMHGLVDHYWSRGAIMVAWSSVGAALAAGRMHAAAVSAPFQRPTDSSAGRRRAPVNRRLSVHSGRGIGAGRASG
jgi:hypothetical protein